LLSENSKIAMVGAGAIGGVTAAFISKAGYDLEIVCKHKDLADKINVVGIDITGIKGDHRIKMKAVEAISDLSEPKDLVFLATKANDCVAAAKDLIPFLKLDSLVVSLQNGISEHALAEILGKERIHRVCRRIRGLCSFFVKEYDGYTGRNPKTGERVKIAPKKLPFFKPGKELKKRVDR
jgi:ketopantoate reductase